MDEGLKLIKRGAEAYLYLIDFHGFKAILKKRIPKDYRHPEFDIKLRQRRTINEARMLYYSKKAGVPVPTVLDVDVDETYLIIEYIDGIVLRDLIDKGVSEDVVRNVFTHVGELIGKLHSNSIVHGDLTTSNMILYNNTLFFIDFGLSEKSNELEDQGVDLHLMLRSLESTHPEIAYRAFNYVLKGYAKVMGREHTLRVRNKVKEIRMRGRYVEERRRKT